MLQTCIWSLGGSSSTAAEGPLAPLPLFSTCLHGFQHVRTFAPCFFSPLTAEAELKLLSVQPFPCLLVSPMRLKYPQLRFPCRFCKNRASGDTRKRFMWRFRSSSQFGFNFPKKMEQKLNKPDI